MPMETDTRTKILQAAFDLFLQRSYKSVSVDDIAKKAGVSKGGLFHHFPSKYILGRDSVLEWGHRMMAGALSEDFDKMAPREQIKLFIDISADVIVKDVNMGRLFIDLYDEALEREEDLGVWIEFLSGYVDLISGIFEKMGEKNPRMRSLIMLSGIDGFAMYHMMLAASGEKIDINDYKQELYHMYLGDD